jgi:hypothetical protein
MHKALSSLVLSTYLLSAGVVVPDDYFISDDENLSYIYSKEYQEILPNLKKYQKNIIDGYEREYGYTLDNTLYVGLASSKNQIANGFSTQFPFNEQLFYGAGAGYIDYFCFSSWLKTLIIHETAHNFQLNPKKNDLSIISHKVLGNTPFSMFSFLPLFPIPNITESSFILEGNGVMNESRYGNGGRLFSGYALAEVVALAKAGKITPELMYNSTLSFPYGESFYLVGGFFQQFLVNKYGIKKVNSYFKTYATQAFPFFTNWVFTKQFGEDFESLLAQFVEEIKEEHQTFKATKGEVLASSQLFAPLNVDSSEIYTLISDKKSSPRVLKIEKKTKNIAYEDGSWRGGELFKIDGEYYSQSSAKNSPTQISMGLFDTNGYLLEGTESKIVQGYTTDNKMVYFDVLSSLESPQVYMGGAFYTQSHSSVYVDKNDLYYFKQEGEKRVLYKNKTALFDYQGHYGFVTEVSDEGKIYFVAPSKHGSSVYCLEDEKVQRVVKGDDVIDFKLLSSTEALVVTVGARGYDYRLVLLDASGMNSSQPYTIKPFDTLKPTPKLKSFSKSKSTPKHEEEYGFLQKLKQSSVNQAMSYNSYSGFGMDVQLNFADPLMQNSLSVPISYNNDRTVAGLQYDNGAYSIEFGGAVYGVYNNKKIHNIRRDYGIESYLHYPFLAKGYWRGSATLAYTKAYDNIHREPLTLSLDVVNHQQFGLSKYANSHNDLSLFISQDRDSNMFGASYGWEHDMPWQTYIGVKGAYLKSDRVDIFLEKGIELSDTFSDLQSDKGTVNMPTFSYTSYADEVKVAEVSFKKVFDGSIYNYSLPLSLQRESVYIKQRLYDIDFTKSINKKYNETVIGLEADVLFLHKLPIPMSLEYLYNPDVQDKEQFRLLFGAEF